MQILQTGSFLNFENAENVEALKFTAQRLAEHSTGAVKENLTAQQLEGLASNLWQKAEYVARETERRRLQQIFVENFTERFRELKPELPVSTIEKADSCNQSFTPEAVAEKPAPIDEKSPENAEKTDEFLGFVKSDDSFMDAPEREEKTAAIEEIAREDHSGESETIAETTKTDNQMIDVVSEKVEETKNNSLEKTEPFKSQPTVKNESSATTPANKTSADGKEPFEFGKCKVSLNLTLLATSDTGKNRKAIVSVASHNLPPEIDFLEIADGEDLEQIAELVKNKLARFRGSLPVKYIEQLRATKNKPAKRNEQTKSSATVAPTQIEKKQHETVQEKVQTEVSTAPLPQVNQQGAGNSIQGSLF